MADNDVALGRLVDVVRNGGLIAYPTDSCYALGWHLGDAGAIERVRRICLALPEATEKLAWGEATLDHVSVNRRDEARGPIDARADSRAA